MERADTCTAGLTCTEVQVQPDCSRHSFAVHIEWSGTKISAEDEAMIKKDKSGYKVAPEKGKNLGSGYRTRAAAAQRLRQVEYFKHHKG
jgi:hypothetical protein